MPLRDAIAAANVVDPRGLIATPGGGAPTVGGEGDGVDFPEVGANATEEDIKVAEEKFRRAHAEQLDAKIKAFHEQMAARAQAQQKRAAEQQEEEIAKKQRTDAVAKANAAAPAAAKAGAAQSKGLCQ